MVRASGERTGGLSAKQRRFVAAYVGEAEGNATHAARLAGYRGSDRTLASVGWENLAKPAIRAAVADHLAEVRRRGIAAKQFRVDALVERHRRLERVVAERAADPAVAGAPGGTTGLLVRRLRRVGDRDVEEFAVDAALLAELRAHEADVAKELGERVDRQQVTADATTVIEFVGAGSAEL